MDVHGSGDADEMDAKGARRSPVTYCPVRPVEGERGIQPASIRYFPFLHVLLIFIPNHACQCKNKDMFIYIVVGIAFPGRPVNPRKVVG